MRRVVSLALIATLAGCGYRPLGHGEISGLPTTVKTIAIGTLKNRTLRPTIQPALKDELIRRFRADARIQLANEGAADTLLEGAIEGFGEVPLAFDRGSDTARRVRVEISFSFTVTDRANQTVLLREGVSGVAYALFAAGIAPTRVAEDEATDRAIADLAERVVMRVLDGI
ncbi:MAG: LPS assembly lipoprotein LptE [Candidatus Methylomirabilaceae bacterium]